MKVSALQRMDSKCIFQRAYIDLKKMLPKSKKNR